MVNENRRELEQRPTWVALKRMKMANAAVKHNFCEKVIRDELKSLESQGTVQPEQGICNQDGVQIQKNSSAGVVHSLGPIPINGNDARSDFNSTLSKRYPSLDSNTIPPVIPLANPPVNPLVNPYSTGFTQQLSLPLNFPQQGANYNQGRTPDRFYHFEPRNPYNINSDRPFNTGTYQNQFCDRGNQNPS